ncbi:external alternative NAD(P)H-ubiquinone oxidoreductase B1, mitochondrial-like isoform X4 [Pistacia vera]|uniref:external alternative NAD(P)H-ubiquinone oxidoreductase B1, mitochondrial isoform X4 n=1 Tax=Pistacia vera TaxID=55513 RepID=UPI00126374EB|nr:external alternative NAD(P)H-ubiquinone oxidoreductase B1, mitochondrial isoform X4 [Pistacia vera]XP_031256763.1 external alternative NAD(P)H-ubiquinone oxidoreductase B1, mitochondrial-like isoform X4 [Pistacia vera]
MTILSSFFKKASTAFNGYSSYSKLLVVCTLSSGGLLAYSESQPDVSTHSVEGDQSESKKKKVVVLGTGWAGTSFLKDLDVSSYDVQVVSPRNYFAFTPLLPSVTCGTVEARSIAEPIRKIIKKELEDALKIRRTVSDCFEKAVLPGLSEEERKTNLHFVVVGGGPTGVEFAAELHDYIQEDLVKLYPSVKDLVKITIIQSGDHILNSFDQRISSFAETKFQRDGIEVLTGCRVISVSDKEISLKIKSTGEVCSIPHGLVLWSTGVGTRPVIRDFMEQIGQPIEIAEWMSNVYPIIYAQAFVFQTDRRALATNEWLQVKGCENVYALGDCATINQRKIMEDVATIFEVADKDKSGTLTVQEFQDVLDDILVRYPQLEIYLKNKHLRGVADLLKDAEGNERTEVDIEGFKSALCHADSQMKSLPATAQVAAQQGSYLSRCFNHMEQSAYNPEGPQRFRGSGRHRFLPFRYKHFGQFAPLGGEQTAAELPGDWVSMGHSTQWLWYSVYASKQVSWRTRILLVSDWTRRFIFGRDSSRI